MKVKQEDIGDILFPDWEDETHAKAELEKFCRKIGVLDDTYNELVEEGHIDYPPVEFPPLATDEEIEAMNAACQAIDAERTKYPPIATDEELDIINKLYEDNPILSEDPWIQTYTGKMFFPLHIDFNSICMEDIAHALSMQCRFTGHCVEFYSVAQHSVLTSYLCDEDKRLEALLHDASEAYIADISSPIKRMPQLAGYTNLENCIQGAIYQKFGITGKSKNVRKADIIMLGIEATSLLAYISPQWKFTIEPPPFKVIPLSPKEAEKLFMDRYIEITNEKRSY